MFGSLHEEIRIRQERWFVFLAKLEARMDEINTAAQTELQQVFNEDDDPYKRAHGHMLSGLVGQINQMRQKANEVREDNIVSFIAETESVFRPFGKLYAFRMACLNRHYVFEEKIHDTISCLKNAAGEPDLEATYEAQLQAFERIRDKFNCNQCGGNIPIPRMFFVATYIHCPFCQSQNTFMPSTGARMVLHQARSLAEQRTAHLLKAYEQSNVKDPVLYRQYLRAMFDEWNKIVPDMAAENEKFYQRLLEEKI